MSLSLMLSKASSHYHATINIQGLPSHKSCPARGEKKYRPGDIFWCGDAPHRCLRNQGRFQLFLDVTTCRCRINQAGADSIDPYSQRPEFHSQIPAKANQCRLCGCIVVIGNKGVSNQISSNRDYCAFCALQHFGQYGLYHSMCGLDRAINLRLKRVPIEIPKQLALLSRKDEWREDG